MFFSAILTLFFVLLGIVKRNSVPVSYVLLLLIYILFAFENTDLPDSDYSK